MSPELLIYCISMRSIKDIPIEELRIVARDSTNFTNMLKNLNIRKTGWSFKLIQSVVIQNSIDIKHFLSTNSGVYHRGGPIKTNEEILVKGTIRGRTPQLRRALLNLNIPYKCKTCGQGAIWFNKPLVLQIDHIDSDRTNNQSNNLCWRCPNCHSQTDSYSVALGRQRCINQYNKHTSGLMFAITMARKNNEINEEEYDKLLNSYRKRVTNRRKTGIGETTTPDIVREIRKKFATGANKCQLAREYKKDRSSIYNIVMMKSYKDII